MTRSQLHALITATLLAPTYKSGRRIAPNEFADAANQANTIIDECSAEPDEDEAVDLNDDDNDLDPNDADPIVEDEVDLRHRRRKTGLL